MYKANSAAPLYLTYFQGDPDRPLLDKTAKDYDKYAWTPVEICSPILPWAQKQEVISTLGRILGTINSHFDAHSNATTETHVHFGRADGRFYSLKTMKKLATLLWLSEPMLRALKDPRSPNFNHHYTWSYPWREQSRIARALQGQRQGGQGQQAKKPLPEAQTVHDLASGRPYDFDNFIRALEDARGGLAHADHHHHHHHHHGPDGNNASLLRFEGQHLQALGAIWRAADHRELGYMLRGPERKFRRLGFNFHALEMTDERAPRTVEFRFLEGFVGGVDRDVVPAWVRLCGELVDLVADRLPPEEEDWEFYDVVALLLDLPGDWPLDAQFSAFVSEMGRGRVPKSVYEPLRAIIRKNYPSTRSGEAQWNGSRCGSCYTYLPAGAK